MRFVLHDHQGKGARLGRELRAAGWKEVPGGAADLLLIDHDVPGFHRQVIEAHRANGAKVVLYPHGAMPIVSWDGIFEPSGLVDLTLTPADGQAVVLHRYGYPGPVAVAGWSYCDLRPFQPVRREGPVKVLFAPFHPTNEGLHAPAKDANARAFEALLQVPGLTLVVRHGDRQLEHSGLWEVPGVIYHAMDRELGGALEDIARADLVVASGTPGYLAVALGKPTVFFGQEVHPWDTVNGEVKYAQHWEAYRDLVRFPFALDDGPAGEVLAEAGRTDAGVRGWRETFIGEPLDGTRFVRLMEQVCV